MQTLRLSIVLLLISLGAAGGAVGYDPNPGGPPDPNLGCPPAERGATFWQTADADFYGQTALDLNGDNVVCWLIVPGTPTEAKGIFIDNRLPDGP